MDGHEEWEDMWWQDGVDVDDSKDFFDTVCVFCDDGGEVLTCAGSCLRSFHPTIDTGIEARCPSLGYKNMEEVKAIHTFLCPNCLHEQHQCFACGILGSSADSAGQEVFRCVSAICGHFYHPQCVAKLLHTDDLIQAKALEGKIAAGSPFTCPVHKCAACKQGENKDVQDFHFAICRRCPKAYHRKCLPSAIMHQFDNQGNPLQRTWENLLLKNRILMYCMDHCIYGELGGPLRNHIKFPAIEVGEVHRCILGSTSGKQEAFLSTKIVSSQSFAIKRTAYEDPEWDESSRHRVVIALPSTKVLTRYARQNPVPFRSTSVTFRGENSWKKSSSISSDKDFFVNGSKLHLRDSECKFRQRIVPSFKRERTDSDKPVMDDEIEKRIMMLVKDVNSSFDHDEFVKRRNASQPNILLSKSFALGLMECSAKAVRVALQRLKEGGSIEDAKTDCGPEVLANIFKWKNMLSVYLAPFLHGNRYTSFGRHFTKVEKLKEIVERLHWYVQDGDMVVDFCCGSNDFSLFMKEELEKAGKSCSFKNYDKIQAKNDFCFEQRNWLSVGVEELPNGSQLIMGLNPPFGVNASLANIFIDKALQFKPKLIILIVPKETKRLDKKGPYNLIWEDDKLLLGEAFYLPGSVDANEQPMGDWNLNAPLLSLWSRRDRTAEHFAIASKHGHLSNQCHYSDGYTTDVPHSLGPYGK